MKTFARRNQASWEMRCNRRRRERRFREEVESQWAVGRDGSNRVRVVQDGSDVGSCEMGDGRWIRNERQKRTWPMNDER